MGEITMRVQSACTYFRHDFGLMNDKDQEELMLGAQDWYQAWQKVHEDEAEDQAPTRMLGMMLIGAALSVSWLVIGLGIGHYCW
jgi:hypothetical protein